MKIIRKKSFIRNCLIQNFISLLIILVICLFISTMINQKLEKSFPVLDDLLKYEDILVNDEYSKIPLKDFSQSAIIIYDSDKKILYSSNKKIGEDINTEDLCYINEDYDSKYYRVYDIISSNNEKQCYIMKIELDKDGEKIIDYAIVNSNNEIIEGNLFSPQKKISELQFNLLLGKYKGYRVEKYQYNNSTNYSRTLLFFYPDFNAENYESAIKEANKLWLISVPFILIIIIIEMILYKKMLKKYLKPLNILINKYKDNKQKITNEDNIASEFQPIVKNFKMLIDTIEKNEIEKNKMIANISHDLKTPLTAIKGYVQAFKDNIVQENKKEQYLNAIYDKIIITEELINRLFEYSKLEHPDYRLKIQEIDINEFTREYLAKKYHEIEIKNFKINIEIPEDKYLCYIDAELFTRLYDNMISNILKHNKSGTIILFKIISQKDIIKIIIADNGEEIPDNIKKELFKPFVTSNNARTSGKGTGLGMVIIKKIVELHDGIIYLNEPACQGYITEFDIELIKNPQ